MRVLCCCAENIPHLPLSHSTTTGRRRMMMMMIVWAISIMMAHAVIASDESGPRHMV